jgi:hypothetical protein
LRSLRVPHDQKRIYSLLMMLKWSRISSMKKMEIIKLEMGEGEGQRVLEKQVHFIVLSFDSIPNCS